MTAKALRVLITNKCSMNCSFCHNEGMQRGDLYLDAKAFGTILDWSKQQGKLKLQVTGGEPFEHPNIGSLIDLLNEKKDCYSECVITTNGINTQAIKEACVELARNRKVRFNVSLPANPLGYPDAYKGMVGLEPKNAQGNYDQILKTLEFLSYTQIPVKINTILTKHSLECIEDFVQYCDERYFEFRLVELYKGSSSANGNNASVNQWIDEHYIGEKELRSRLRDIGYIEKLSGEKRVTEYVPANGIGRGVKLIRCCPQICSNCEEELSCLRILPSGAVAACFFDIGEVEQADQSMSLVNKEAEEAFVLLNDANEKMKKSMAAWGGKPLVTKNDEEVILFISFDITNSSSVKLVDSKSWQFALVLILERIKLLLREQDNNPELIMWRIIGDELVFYRQLRRSDRVESILKVVLNVLKTINDEIDAEKFINRPFSVSNASTVNSKLGVRATAWIAPVYFPKDINFIGEADFNFGYVFSMQDSYRYGLLNLEFMGNDFDLGFSLSKEAKKNEFIVSYELAKLLYKQTGGNTEKLKLLRYVPSLGKGSLWENEDYPIFQYGESSESNIGEIFNRVERRQKRVTEKIEHINYVLDRVDSINNLVQPLKPFDVHFNVICYKLADGVPMVLMLQRQITDSNTSYSGQWDFGYCKLDSEALGSNIGNFGDIIKAIEILYKEQYNIDIKVQERLLSMYHDNSKEYETVIGIRLAAEIKEDRIDYQFEGRLFTGETSSKYRKAKQFTYEEFKSTFKLKNTDDYKLINHEQYTQVLEELIGPNGTLYTLVH